MRKPQPRPQESVEADTQLRQQQSSNEKSQMIKQSDRNQVYENILHFYRQR